jgi:hypothetical protein
METSSAMTELFVISLIKLEKKRRECPGLKREGPASAEGEGAVAYSHVEEDFS